jgi:D-alanyl-D-alanine carboxypeptidase (penicillin-binding protein 5/6)
MPPTRMFTRLCAFFTLGLAVCLASCLAGRATSAHAQAPSAKAYIVFDTHAGKILLAQNAGLKLPVASLTKIATACVALDWAERTGVNLSRQMAVVPPSAATLTPNPFNFAPGDTISLRDALSCALMGSDNIAAETIAWHVGADLQARTGKGRSPYEVFVKQMNSLTTHPEIGMTSTRFLNPHGLDTGRSVPVSTAADMARLTRYALKKPAFVFHTSQKERRITVLRGGAQQELFLLKNTNTSLGRAGIDGVKTGTTARAGQCLILTAPGKTDVVKTGPDQETVYPRRLVVVVLASPDRFAEGEMLLRQGWGRYDEWHRSGRTVASADELLGP